MAVAYNVPFGGALFSLEVLLGSLALPLVLPALATSLIATAVSWLFLPMGSTYHIPAEGFSIPAIVWAVLAAPVIGLAFCSGQWLIAETAPEKGVLDRATRHARGWPEAENSLFTLVA